MKATVILVALMVTALSCGGEEPPPTPEPLTAVEAQCTIWVLDSTRRSSHQGNPLQEFLDYMECLESPRQVSASDSDLERRVQELERRLMELELKQELDRRNQQWGWDNSPGLSESIVW